MFCFSLLSIAFQTDVDQLSMFVHDGDGIH